jgi:hypothetical protein
MAACCTTVRDIITRAARLLGDVEHAVWPVDVLVQHLNEGLCELQSYRPDAFIKTVELTLRPGREQRLSAEYRRIVSINANITGDGTEGRMVSEVSDAVLRAFSKRPCVDVRRRDCYEVLSWSRNKTDPRIFYVSPPVPPGHRALVSATVVMYPPRHLPTKLDECVGVDCAYDAQLLDWVLSRAYEEDIESVRNTEMAVRHKRNFYDALGIEYLQESRFNSGRWLGREADGDTNKSLGTMPPDTRRA